MEFSPLFLELNYWQAKIMLYRPCLSVSGMLPGELGGQRDKAAKGERVEEEDRVYLVVAEAGQKVLRIYRQLHRVHQVNYTFLATHHLFMAGSFPFPPYLALANLGHQVSHSSMRSGTPP